MYTTFILLGSNLGDSNKYLADAIIEIGKRLGRIIQKSSLYQTASWGNLNQPDFLNQVVELQTAFSPTDLLRVILDIEIKLGRERHEKWGSRTIDIDILLYEDLIIDEVNLKIPHPFLHYRRFALMPLAEIAPDLIHPIMAMKIKELLLNLSDELYVKKLT